jgi:hypothetical protein
VTPLRFALASALFALGILALVVSVEVGRDIAAIDANLADVADDMETHLAAGGGTSLDGDGYGASLEILRVNNLAWRNELVVRLWTLRVVGPVLGLTAVIWLGVSVLTRGSRRRRGPRRARPSRRRTRPGRARSRPPRKKP